MVLSKKPWSGLEYCIAQESLWRSNKSTNQGLLQTIRLSKVDILHASYLGGGGKMLQSCAVPAQAVASLTLQHETSLVINPEPGGAYTP